MTGKRSCYNGDCPFNFNDTCGKEGVAEAKYCRDFKPMFDCGGYSQQ